jgi:hypothetical protein
VRALTCNEDHTRRTPIAVDCRSRSGEPSSATVCCHRVRSTIGRMRGIEPTGGQCRRLCAGVCIASCASSATALAVLRRSADRGCGACASLYNNPLKTDIAFIGRFASKSPVAGLYEME